MSDFFTPLERTAAFHPDKPAIRFAGRTISYGTFVARVRAIAGALKRDGVGAGDRVAVLSTNHPDMLALLFAVSRVGAILVPLNWRLAPDELAYAIGHCEPSILVHGEEFAGVACQFMPAENLRAVGSDALAGDEAELSAGAPDAPCLLVYTSGTTGRPKGALISNASLMGNAVQSHHMHQMTADDHVLTVLPLFHVGGLNIQTTPALLAGATVTLHERFDAAATLDAVVADRPSLTVLVPATIEALAATPGFGTADLSSLRAVATGSTIVSERVIARLTDRGVPVLCIYGATETCPIAAYDRAGQERVPGGTGRAGLLTDLAVVDGNGRAVPTGQHGEIAVRGPIFSGYYRDEAATREAFVQGHWLSGDLGSLSPDGTLTVHERKKNMIVSGGENIYPAEIERVLSGHPAVSACAVVAKPDQRWDEVPVAFVVVSDAIDATALVAHVGEHLARFKVPRDLRIVPELPRTALGKIQHDVLRRAAAAPLASEPAKA
ncbi:MAG: AMP-binding protein [Pseudomonadota bacterium]